MKIKCINCGAIFESDKNSCPYCNYINIEGAEEEYLENLDGILDDYYDIENNNEENMKKEAISIILKTFRTLIITLIVIYIVGMLTPFANSAIDEILSDDEDVMEKREQLIWEKETFPKLDEWYEQGDYEAISEFIIEAEKSRIDFYKWEHEEFIDEYENYMDFQSIKKAGEERGQYTAGEISDILINVLNTKTSMYYDRFCEEDIKMSQKYIQEQYDFLISEFLYTEEELEQLYETAIGDDYLDRDKLEEEAKIREGKLYD